jgi:hypothetical protein
MYFFHKLRSSQAGTFLAQGVATRVLLASAGYREVSQIITTIVAMVNNPYR